MRQRRKGYPVPMLVVCVIGVCSFVGGMAINAFSIADRIATKPYVEEKVLDLRKYTDERTAQTLKDAYEHADMNRQVAALDMEKYGSTVKSLEVKIDNMREMIDRLYSTMKRK
jgi:hypothetical protein